MIPDAEDFTQIWMHMGSRLDKSFSCGVPRYNETVARRGSESVKLIIHVHAKVTQAR